MILCMFTAVELRRAKLRHWLQLYGLRVEAALQDAEERAARGVDQAAARQRWTRLQEYRKQGVKI